MAEERGGEQPEIGPLSVPTRVLPSSDGGRPAGTIVPLVARRPRRRVGLRPPGAAPSASAATVPARPQGSPGPDGPDGPDGPARPEGPEDPDSRAPQSTGSGSGSGSDGPGSDPGHPPAPRRPTSPPPDALPTQPVARGRPAPRVVGTTPSTLSGLPTERVATAAPTTPAADRTGDGGGGDRGGDRGGGADGPSRRTAAVDPRDAEYAATSTVLATARSRLAGWRRGWTWQRSGRLLSSFVAVLVLLVTGLGWGATSWLEAAVRQIGALDPDSSAIRNAAAQQGDQNFLVVGSDTRIGAAAAAEAGDSSDVPGARADTVMIVHVPEDRRGVTVVAFPRDLEVTRPECERWDSVSGRYTGDVIPRTPKVKLNTAYAAGGPRCVTKVVQELSGLAVNRFLGVDFQGFQGMVDAVGGVPVCVERPVRDTILGVVVPRGGTSTLDGEQALDFVRARHVVGDPSSDYGRIQRQQRFLSSLLRTALSTGTLFDPGRLQGFVDAVSRSTFGENIGSDQLITLAQSLGNLDPRAVTFTTVPTTGQANGRGNEVLRTAADRDLFASIIDDRPLPGAAPTPPAPGRPGAPPPGPTPAPAAPTTPQQVRATLVDGRSTDATSDDAASTVAGELRAQGFGVVPDDRAARSDTTTIRFSSDQAAAASLLARSVPGATLDPSAPGRGTLTITLGDDFDGRITSPGDAAAAKPVVPTITAADASCT